MSGNPRNDPSRKRSGMALLAVLICVAVLALLAVAYFDLARRTTNVSEARSSAETAARANESALNLAQSQIQAATAAGLETCWTSQPGAIRTFSNVTGEPVSVFKLYSASLDAMVVSGAGFSVAGEWAPSDWAQAPGVWSDLNAPSRGAHPIVSPEALNPPSGGSYTDSRVEGFSIDSSAAPVTASGTASLVPMPVRWIYQLRDGTLVTPTGGSTAQTQLPGATRTNPPVARFAFWTDDDTCKLNINTASETAVWDTPRYATPTDVYFQRHAPANREFQRYPGHPATTSLRPALWSYLGLPSPDWSVEPQINLSKNGGWFTHDLAQSTVSAVLDTNADAYVRTVFGSGTESGLVPRAVWDGSQQGTAITATGTGTAVSWSALFKLPLYTSPDELLFSRPDLSSVAPGAERPRTKIRTSGGAQGDAFQPADLETLGFFLSTSSRAPEVNLYNQPRISLWPVDDPTRPNPSNDYFPAVADSRSPLDRLMTFCATIGGRGYYFTRNDPNDPAGDWTTRNEQIANYLYHSLSRTSPLKLPGTSTPGSFVSKFGSSVVRQQITSIYDYLRAGVNTIDSSGGATGTTDRFKYAFAKPPLTNDRVRAGSAQIVPFQHPSNGTKGSGRFPTLQQAALMFIARAADQPPLLVDASHQPLPGNTANPMHPYTDSTFALAYRQLTVSGSTHAGLRYLTDPVSGAYNDPNPGYSGPALGLYQTEMQAMLILRPVINSAGLPMIGENYRIRVTGLQGFRANGSAIFASDTAEMTVATPDAKGTQNHIPDFEYMFLENKASQAIIGVPVVVGGNAANQGAEFDFTTTGPLTVTFLTISGEEVQEIQLRFPDETFPTPKLPSFIPVGYEGHEKTPDHFPTELLTFTSGTTGPGRLHNASTDSGNKSLKSNWIFPEMNVAGEFGARTADTVKALEFAAGDTRLVASMKNVSASSNLFLPHKFYTDKTRRAAHSLRDYEQEQVLMRGGTVSPLASQFETFPGAYPHPFSTLNWANGASQWYLRVPSHADKRTLGVLFPHTTSGVNFDDAAFATLWSRGGDFDSGQVNHAEGPFLNKPDEGALNYFSTDDVTKFTGAGLFSPNRQMPSGVMLGSLPSRLNPAAANPDQAWQTFVFSPNPNAGANHSGLQSNPPDYAIQDLFWMPVVEPYAISEPLSTAGKVNMNHQIVPFSYIKRDTALRGVLRTTMITAVADRWVARFKGLALTNTRIGDGGGAFDTEMQNSGMWGFRFPVHAGETLKQFDKKFTDGGVFLSEAEICSLWLYPAAQPTSSAPDAAKNALVAYNDSASNIRSWWYDNAGGSRKSLTADNMRERPYALLYPRLTTRSNTYTVHIRAQALAPSVTTDGVYVERAGAVLAEWRGSHGIERYVDPSDPDLQGEDFATSGATLSPFYKMRVLHTSRFQP